MMCGQRPGRWLGALAAWVGACVGGNKQPASKGPNTIPLHLLLPHLFGSPLLSSSAPHLHGSRVNTLREGRVPQGAPSEPAPPTWSEGSLSCSTWAKQASMSK